MCGLGWILPSLAAVVTLGGCVDLAALEGASSADGGGKGDGGVSSDAGDASLDRTPAEDVLPADAGGSDATATKEAEAGEVSLPCGSSATLCIVGKEFCVETDGTVSGTTGACFEDSPACTASPEFCACELNAGKQAYPELSCVVKVSTPLCTIVCSHPLGTADAGGPIRIDASLPP